MKIKLFILSLFISSICFGQETKYGTKGIDINGNSLPIVNGGTSLFTFKTTVSQSFVPIVLPAYATGSEPAGNWLMGFDSDSATNAVWYRDGSGALHRFGSIGGGGGGGTSPPFPDNSAVIENNADHSKLLILSAASISASTTRTWTFPDANGTVARNDAGQTFTGANTFGAGQTFGNNLVVGAPTTSAANILITASAAVNPTSPTDGMFWYNGTNLNFRKGSTTVDLLSPSCATCFTSSANAFGTTATLGTTDAFDLIIKSGNLVVATFYHADGHLGLGTGAGGDPTQTFYVPGTSRFDGAWTIGANGGISVSSGFNFSSSAANNSASNRGFSWGMNNPFGSGNKSFMAILGDATLTSGTSSVNQLDIFPTYNNSGAGTYTVRGIYYHPTLTSLTGTTHIAFENETGDNIFNNTSGASTFTQGANFSSTIKSTGGVYNNVKGSQLLMQSSTINNAITSASGTVGEYVTDLFDIATQTATNSSVTYTNASTVYIAGAPAASTNITITNPFALKIAAGKSQFNGSVQIVDGTQAANTYLVGDASGNASWATAPTSASYTPTLTNTTNIASSALNQAYYIRVGNIVHVTISGSVTASGIGATLLTFSLPFTTATTTQTSDVAASIGLNGGTAFTSGEGSIASGTTGNMKYIATAGTSDNFTIIFTYTL